MGQSPAQAFLAGVVALGVHGAAGVRRVMLNHGQSEPLASRIFCVMAAGAATLSAAIMTGLARG